MSAETSRTGTEVVTLGRRVLRLAPGLPLDERIAQVAEMQHGAITVAQLRRCGLGDSGVRRRAARGLLHRLHRGVYVPGHRRLPPLGRVAAAVLASGPDAVASHLTGARLYGTRSDSQTLVDVTVGSRTGRRHTGVISHSAATIRPQDITVVDGIPVTSIARTLLDCAPILGRRGTEKMVADAERLQLFNLVAVEEILAHVPGHAGAAILRAAVADAAGARGHTASCAEDALLVAFRAAGLPEPECNAAIQLDDGSFVFADFLWREACLVAEADPRGTHDRTASYRSDRRRDRALDRVGLETMRFSDEDLRDPAACAAEVAERHNFRAGAARKL